MGSVAGWRKLAAAIASGVIPGEARNLLQRKTSGVWLADSSSLALLGMTPECFE